MALRDDGVVDPAAADEAVEVLARLHVRVHAFQEAAGARHAALGNAEVGGGG